MSPKKISFQFALDKEEIGDHVHTNHSNIKTTDMAGPKEGILMDFVDRFQRRLIKTTRFEALSTVAPLQKKTAFHHDHTAATAARFISSLIMSG